jgi:hypothetical protein
MIEADDWTDPIRLEARVAAVVERNRLHLSDPVLAPAALRRLTEELARSLGAAGIPDARGVAAGLLAAAIDRAGLAPIPLALELRRIDPDLRMARFYRLMVERDLFGTIRLVRTWAGSAPTARSSSRCSRARSRPEWRLKRWPRRSGGGDTGIYEGRRAGMWRKTCQCEQQALMWVSVHLRDGLVPKSP